MNNLPSRLCVLLLAALFASIAGAQSEPSAETRREEAIRLAENEERLAVLGGDTASLERLWSASMIVNNPQSRISANRDAVLELVRKGLIRYSSFERTIEAIRFEGQIAIVMGAETVVPTGNAPGAGHPVHRRFTNLWKHQGNGWVMIGRHANVIPAEARRDANADHQR